MLSRYSTFLRTSAVRSTRSLQQIQPVRSLWKPGEDGGKIMPTSLVKRLERIWDRAESDHELIYRSGVGNFMNIGYILGGVTGFIFLYNLGLIARGRDKGTGLNATLYDIINDSTDKTKWFRLVLYGLALLQLFSFLVGCGRCIIRVYYCPKTDIYRVVSPGLLKADVVPCKAGDITHFPNNKVAKVLMKGKYYSAKVSNFTDKPHWCRLSGQIP